MKDEMATNKQHKDGLNTDMDMVYSSKCKTTVFEIQTGTLCPVQRIKLKVMV